MHDPNDSRPQQTANRLRALVFIPAFIAVVGILVLAVKLAGRLNALEEPAARDYPPSPPPRAGGGGTPLVPAAVRPGKRAQAANPPANAIAPIVASRSEPGTPDNAPVAAAPTPVATPAAAAALPPTNIVQAGIGEIPAAGIVGRVLLRGTPPPEKVIPVDPSCGKLHASPLQTRFYVVGTNGGLVDVFVGLKDLPAGPWKPPAAPVEIRQRGCQYLPYVSAAQTGQTIRVFNDDPVLHNPHATPTAEGQSERFRVQKPKQSSVPVDFVFPRPEPFLRFKCDVHPWMFAYVTVVEHPFFTVSGAEGKFALPELPPGNYTLQFHHRKAGEKLVPVTMKAGKRLLVTVTLDVADPLKHEAVVAEE